MSVNPTCVPPRPRSPEGTAQSPGSKGLLGGKLGRGRGSESCWQRKGEKAASPANAVPQTHSFISSTHTRLHAGLRCPLAQTHCSDLSCYGIETSKPQVMPVSLWHQQFQLLGSYGSWWSLYGRGGWCTFSPAKLAPGSSSYLAPRGQKAKGSDHMASLQASKVLGWHIY